MQAKQTHPPEIGLTGGQIHFDEKLMIVENIKPFEGQHCETIVTGTLLMQQGIELSEPPKHSNPEAFLQVCSQISLMIYHHLLTTEHA